MNKVTIQQVKPEFPFGSLWHDRTGEVYILCNVDGERATLIPLNGGNRFRDPVKLSRDGVSESVWQEICGNRQFARILGTVTIETN